MKNSIVTLSIISLALLLLPFQVQAQNAGEDILSSCVQINNGGDTCYQSDTITINKKVLKPETIVKEGQKLNDSDFIENTTLRTPYTRANSLSAFRLYVTNISNADVENVTIIDTLPEKYLTYVTSEGTYNETNRTTEFTIDTLKKGETKAFTIQIMTAMGSLLPSDPVCVTNQAKVTVTRKRFFIIPNDTKESQDNARLCITKNEQGGSPLSQMKQQNQTSSTPGSQAPSTTKGGLPVVSPTPAGQTPETGAEALALFGLLPAGAAGMYLRRKTR